MNEEEHHAETQRHREERKKKRNERMKIIKKFNHGVHGGRKRIQISTPCSPCTPWLYIISYSSPLRLRASA
jgi:hypothetical protein